jgi:iron complex outermembrane recepter protein
MRIAVVATAICLSVVGFAVADNATAAIRKSTNIPAEGLGPALTTLAKEFDFQVLYRTEIVGKLRTDGATGTLTATEALDHVLSGTGLTYRYLDDKTVTIVTASGTSQAAASAPPDTNDDSSGASSPTKEGGGSSSGDFRLAQENQGSAPGSSMVGTANQNSTIAQPSGPALTEIIVTAQKRAENIQDVPAAITAITGESIQQQGITQFSDYMALVPSLEQNSNGAPGHGTVLLRGLSTGSQQTAATVAYLIDDVPFTASGSQAIAALITPDPDLSDIERIEVLKGPQGTLYGASSIGGLIKIVSKSPDLQNFSGSVRVDGSTVDDGGTGYGVRTTINVPLISDIMAVRLTAFDRQDPGFMKNVATGANDTNKADVSGGRLTLRIQPDPDWTIDITGFTQEIHSYGVAAVDSNPVTLQPLYCDRCYDLPVNTTFQTQYHIGSAVVNWSSKAGTLTNSLSYADYDDLQTFDDGRSYNIVNSLDGVSVPPGNTVIFFNHPATHKFTEELRFASRRWNNFEALIGTFFTHEANTYNNLLINTVPPILTPIPGAAGNFLTANESSTYKELAGFADLTYYLTSTVDMTIGARRSHHTEDANLEESGILNGSVTTTSYVPSADSSTTYLATLRYRPTADLDTYARIASGYRPGGPVIPPIPGEATTFKPDTVTNYELGAKARWLEGRLTTDIAVYYIDWKDIQLNELVEGITVQGNGGTATVKGVEFDSQYIPVRGLTLALTAAYTKNPGF